MLGVSYENGLFDWAKVVLPPSEPRRHFRWLAKRTFPSTLKAPNIQLNMEFDKVVRLAPHDKLHLLDYTIDSFLRGDLPEVFYIQEALEETSVFLIGQLIQMSEEELSQFTTRKTLIGKIRAELRRWGLDLGLKAPHWRPGMSLACNFDAEAYLEHGQGLYRQ